MKSIRDNAGIILIAIGVVILLVAFANAKGSGSEQSQYYPNQSSQNLQQNSYSGGSQAGGSCCANGGPGQQGAGQGSPSGSCCSSGKSIDKNTAKKKALAYYYKKYKDKNVTAKVEDFGCHFQINIYKGNKLVKAISFRGGKLSELN